MKHLVPALAVFFLLLSAVQANADQGFLVHGYHIDAAQAQKSGLEVLQGRTLILAQVFNPGPNPLKAGNYEVGVELGSTSKPNILVIKPQIDIPNGAMRSFRIGVPHDGVTKTEYRLFAKVEGKAHHSPGYWIGKTNPVGTRVVTTLYTEPPPEPDMDSIKPPPEIPFEHELKAKAPQKPRKPAREAGRKRRPKAPPPAVIPTPAPVQTAAATEAIKPAATPARPRRPIDPSEFKTLRTIDEELVIYVVKQGDTLPSIAERYYGTPEKGNTIARLNFIDNPKSIRVGEEIIVDVRPLGRVVLPSGPTPKSLMNLSGGSKSYTIQSGDTLAEISRRVYGTTSKVDLIIKANPGLDPKRLRIGTSILIPADGDNA